MGDANLLAITLKPKRYTMYVLDLTSDYGFPLTVTGYIVGTIVLYYVIRIAVSDGTQELKDLLRRQNHLRQIELQKNGWSPEEIEKDLAREGQRN